MSETTPQDTPQDTAPDLAGPFVARAGRYYRTTRYLMFGMFLLFGVWFLRDGFFKYPAENQQRLELSKEQDRLESATPRDEKRILEVKEKIKELKWHTPMDLLIQRALGILLPPIAIALLAWWMFNSRGEYRLENGVLSVPGHGPVPPSRFTTVDKELWDRKGILFIDYTDPNGQARRLKLDDFVYDAVPTRAIAKAIEAYMEANPAQFEPPRQTVAAIAAEPPPQRLSGPAPAAIPIRCPACKSYNASTADVCEKCGNPLHGKRKGAESSDSKKRNG